MTETVEDLRVRGSYRAGRLAISSPVSERALFFFAIQRASGLHEVTVGARGNRGLNCGTITAVTRHRKRRDVVERRDRLGPHRSPRHGSPADQ